MRGFIRIGRILGIPVGINPSWFVLLFLIVTTLATQAFPAELGPRRQWEYWALALAAALVFFISMVLHELGHSVMARHFGIPVRSITLFVLGAVAQTTRETRRPGQEFLMAVAGPAVSVLLGGLFMVLWFLFGQGANTFSQVAGWLWIMNIAVGIFNMIPAYPMDGGRVLRAALWGLTRNQRRATRWAAYAGRGIAWTAVTAGVLVLANVPGLDDVPMLSGAQFILLGLFLNFAAGQGDEQSSLLDYLSRYQVADVMLRDVPAVLEDTTVGQALSGPLSGYGPGRDWLLLSDGARCTGLAARAALQNVPVERWGDTPVKALRVPSQQIEPAAPTDLLSEIIQRMDASDAPVMLVIADGVVTGVIHRGLLTGLIERRSRAA